MNYATDTANFGMLQHISLCKLLATLIAILHLQGGFSVRSFKDGAGVLPMNRSSRVYKSRGETVVQEQTRKETTANRLILPQFGL